MSNAKNAWLLVKVQWSECVVCFDCPCGAAEIIISEPDAKMCDCGRVYRMDQSLTVTEPEAAE